MKSTYFITLLSLCITSDVLSHPFMQGFGQSMANMQQNLQNAFNGPSYPGNYQLQSYDPNYQGNNGWNDNFKNSLNFPVSSSQGNSGWNNQFQNSLNFPNVRNSPGNSGWYDPFQNNNRNFPGSSCWNNQCQNNWNFDNGSNFPGNSGWRNKHKNSLSFLDDPDFPGNPGWNEKQKKSMSFLNDPDFPGNPGWNEKLKKSMSFLDDPDFPGNPGWNEKQKKSMSYLKDPYFPGNPGWLANLKRETTLPTNCSKINDVLGTTTFPSHSPNTVVYGPGGYPTYLSYLPATKTTYYCNDPVFYDQPFLMLETRTTINNGNRTSVHSAYTLYNLQGMQFKQGNVVKSTEVGNNYVNNYF